MSVDCSQLLEMREFILFGCILFVLKQMFNIFIFNRKKFFIHQFEVPWLYRKRKEDTKNFIIIVTNNVFY